MRFLFSSLTLTLALVGCSPEPGNSFKSAVTLPLVTQPDGFQIDFPGAPEAWQSQFESSQGTMIVHHLSGSQGSVTYSVAWHDYPNPLSDAQRIEELGSDWTEDSEIGGFPAMAQVTNQGDKSTLGRMLLLDQRFYSVHVGGPKSTLDAEKAQRFFDSFKIDSTR